MRCRSCAAEVTVVVLEVSLKKMPVNKEPSSEGNVEVRPARAGELYPRAQVLCGSELHLAQSSGHLLYVSHFATCPDAKRWRKR